MAALLVFALLFFVVFAAVFAVLLGWWYLSQAVKNGETAPAKNASRRYVMVLNTNPKTRAAKELAAEFRRVGVMSGAEFEEFTADVIRALGYGASVLGGSGDQGVDIIAVNGEKRIAVQCKNYAKPVGNKPIQEVYAGAKYHQCNEAWVIAPFGFTKGAEDLARTVDVSLFDSFAIFDWINRTDESSSKMQ